MAGLSLVCYRGIAEILITIPKTVESTFGSELAKVLRRKHPGWLDRIGVESVAATGRPSRNGYAA